MTKPKSDKKFKISFRFILTILTFALIIYVVWKNFAEIQQAFGEIAKMNGLGKFILLLLIPEQLFMYYCCGQIFFSYMASKKSAKRVSAGNLMRISLELNFVNHAVPAGGLGGLGYIAWRLKPFGATAGQSSFMYVLRYVITICANQLQTIIAILALLIFGGVPAAASWVIWVTALLSFGILGAIMLVIVIASSQKRIDWCVDHATVFCNWLVKKITFGHVAEFLDRKVVSQYLNDIHDDLITARRHKRTLIRPILWGILYSFLEVATYWIVAMSLGRPEILPQIMIGEAIGSVLGSIIPYGLYELGMAGIMISLGVPFGDATTIVLITRVIVLLSTIISGYGFYQNAISKIGKKERAEIMKETEN